MKGKLAATVATAVVLTVGSALVPTAASAASLYGCPAGYACVWDYPSYSGTTWQRSVTSGNYTASTLNNAANSVVSNGASCAYTYWYDGWDLTGSNFGLYSYTMWPANDNEDNYLTDGIQNALGLHASAAQNWDNRISSHKFSGCR